MNRKSDKLLPSGHPDEYDDQKLESKLFLKLKSKKKKNILKLFTNFSHFSHKHITNYLTKFI